MRRVKQVTYTFIGFIFILLAIAGFILPFVQGWIFMIIGLVLISLESPDLDNFLQKQARRHVTVDKYFSKFRLWTRSKLGYN